MYKQGFFRSKDGALAVWQKPNLPIVVWAVAQVLQWPLSGGLEHFAQLVGTAAVLLWASLEVFDGDSYFRRMLGVVVLALTIMSVTQN